MNELDRPAWGSLVGEHSPFALRRPHGARYSSRNGMLAALDPSLPPQHEAAAIADLASVDGQLVLLQADRLHFDERVDVLSESQAVQMVFRSLAADAAPLLQRANAVEIIELADSDIPDMQQLAIDSGLGALEEGAPELGRYVGIRENGELIAMAGERLRPGRQVEVSGVCTASAARGRGLGALLTMEITDGIVARGLMPFLHAYEKNVGAIRLYEALGFEHHQGMFVYRLAASTPHSE